MRILYFTRDYSPHDHRFLKTLADSEHEIFSLRLERRGLPREERSLPPAVQPIRWRGGERPAHWRDYPALLFDLKRVLRRIKTDVVHAGSIHTAAFLTALSGYQPLVSMSWGSDLLVDADRNGWYRWVTCYTLERSAVMIGDCRAVRQKAGQFGFPEQRTVLFPWGVDLTHFSPAPTANLRRRLGWQDAFVILSLRSWEALYGVDHVAQAFATAAEAEPRLRLLLLGEGSLAGSIHRTFSQHNLLDRVHFGGRVDNDDLVQYYRAADLYLSASHSDGSSVSLMEALACGLPVLVSDIPSNREWITAGEQGWLFRDGDEVDLAAKMVLAVQKEHEFKVMGSAARKLAEERADWSINQQGLWKAYAMALAKEKVDKTNE